MLPADTKPEQIGLDKPTVVTLDTFDNFTYTIKLGQKTNDNLPMVVAVTAQIPKERTPGKDEKPEDKARLDKEFKEKQKKLEDKLSQEQSYGNGFTWFPTGRSIRCSKSAANSSSRRKRNRRRTRSRRN